MAPDAILGREAELATIARFFDDVGQGPRALLIEGDAGIGKTTLWRESVRLAQRRGRVLISRASDAEARLSFAVLGDVLVPALDEGGLERLPARQRRSLEAALMLGEPAGSRPDSRAVALAVLEVLRSLAAEDPLTLAIDDVQWVDGPSARAFAFALRRFVDEPITVVAARRMASGVLDSAGPGRVAPGRRRSAHHRSDRSGSARTIAPSAAGPRLRSPPRATDP